jgi:hypothetical protein
MVQYHVPPQTGLSMNSVVLEHVPVTELPAAWRAKFIESMGATVTIRIEEEIQAAVPAEAFITADPAFGIWRDREDMADVGAYMSKIRQPRYNRDGSRNKP